MSLGRRACFWFVVLVLSCSKPPSFTPLAAVASPPPTPSAGNPTPRCGGGRRLTAHFYDVSQGLSVLVSLPDGRRVLVDAGDSPTRPGCGDVCVVANRHLLDTLRVDLHGAPLDLLWITHQHSDHIGGAFDVLDGFQVDTYVDNGRDSRHAEVRRSHRAAEAHGTTMRVIEPDHADAPIPGSVDVRITPIVPSSWPLSCSHEPNECSIGVRIDFCASSILFTGDAEHDEERQLDARGGVTLLQVAHHGSETSTTPGFLSKIHPSYAVISAGRPGEGTNVGYCHPRAIVVKRLSTLMGGVGSKVLKSFDGDRCANARPSDWIDAPTSDRLWATLPKWSAFQ